MNKNTKNNTANSTITPSLVKGLSWVTQVYFVGIGGIGMSALARYFVAQGKQVAGYDKTPSAITEALQDLAISIHFKDEVSQINTAFLDASRTLVVYTPAIPDTHTELNYFRTNGFTVCKRSEVLGEITRETHCLAVAGTHGKTTTTSILGHLLMVCNVPVTAFLGGVSENYDSNLILNGTDVTVVEADEFDRSFLTLSPNTAGITSMDADHLDIYGNEAALVESFKAFTNCVKPDGKCIVKKGLTIEGLTYGVEDDSDYCASNVKIIDGSYVFNLKTPQGVFNDMIFHLPGRHNLSNAVLALAMAIDYGCDPNRLKVALASYKGVKRRFTYHIKSTDFVFIDDYAHHPEEINAVHDAVREMYPNRKVLAIFQPHLFSRTQDFADDFAESLSKFDIVRLLEIYPARELPIKGINAQWLLDKISNPNKALVAKNQLIEEIKNSNAQVVLTIGAGDIGVEVQRIKTAFSFYA